jgi:hypothetical protein
VQGGNNGSLAKTATNVAVQFLLNLGNRRVGSAGSTGAVIPARLHLTVPHAKAAKSFLDGSPLRCVCVEVCFVDLRQA